MIEEILIVFGVIIGLWIIFMILAPIYVITENFIEKRIRNTGTSKKIAKKLKGKTKKQTLRNVYKYINNHFYGDGHQFDYLTPPEFFDMGITERLLLHKKRFLWCSNQIALLTSLLVNTGQFTKEDIGLGKGFGKWPTAHFYSIVKIGKNKIKVDPFYDIFKPIK